VDVYNSKASTGEKDDSEIKREDSKRERKKKKG